MGKMLESRWVSAGVCYRWHGIWR